jgi:hypothetical protein
MIREKGENRDSNPEEIVEGDESQESIDAILGDALGEIGESEDMAKIEEEEYAEKKEREIIERGIQEEESRFESVSKCAFAEGAATFSGLKTGEDLARLNKTEDRKEVRDEHRRYIEQLEEDLRGGGYTARELPSNILMGREDLWLDFGACTHRIEGRLTRDSYFDGVRATRDALDKRVASWAKKNEGERWFDIRKKTEIAATQRHLEGFGTAALDFGKDPDTAARAFIEGGLMDNPEIVKKLADKMTELYKSGDEETKRRVVAAKKRVMDWLRTKNEGGAVETDAGEE